MTRRRKINDTVKTAFEDSLARLESAGTLLKHDYVKRLLSHVDVLTDTRDGLDYLYEEVPRLIEAGIFEGGAWEDPDRLVPPLVGGTLRAGGESTLMEVLSELRVLALAEGRVKRQGMSRASARDFLEQVLVNNLALIFPETAPEEEPPEQQKTARKVGHLMGLLTEHIPVDEIKDALATEIELICLQRPVMTGRVLKEIGIVHDRIPLDPDREGDRRLLTYVDAVFAPSEAAADRTPGRYATFLSKADRDTREEECRELGQTMRETGLAVPYHAHLVRRVASNPSLLALALGLDGTGEAELEKHQAFVTRLIHACVHPDTARACYGLARLLDRALLSHQPVRSGLERLESLELHPEVQENIRRSRPGSELEPRRILLSDCLCVLGQPLGIGQGANPTCQSARGISLWSRHAPGKLTGLIETAASTNELAMRFEGQVIRSSELVVGLATDFNYHLDAVSVVLVPHLDRIYNEMMRRASYRGEDPHKWVNPAMYGQWIPTGFLSAYDYMTETIREYDHFLRTFYATHHPDFNGGHDLAYPNPVGIFLTTVSGALIGFHAVSILRVRRHRGKVRVYILNPNTEGRQRWHGGIEPTVSGHGEEPGESSLLFHEFASILYAFHFSPSQAGELDHVDEDEMEQVTRLARGSWGRAYQWPETPAIGLPGVAGGAGSQP